MIVSMCIVLINGVQLSKPMIRYNIGCRDEEVLHLKQVDDEFFEGVMEHEGKIKKRFGNPVEPREWFLVPPFVIDEAIEKFKDGTIDDYVYDPESVSLKEAS